MAIQNRRGADADFDPQKMLPGEFAFTTDGSDKVYACTRAGNVIELASKAEFKRAVDDFLTEVNNGTINVRCTLG